jgi:hypothetical protein
VQSHADILASLDRALAEAGECKIATNSEPRDLGVTLETHDVEGGQNDAALVNIQHPLPTHPSLTPSYLPLTYGTPSQSKQLQEAAAKARASIAGPWRKLWAHQKLARAFIAAEEQGGISFTLNLSARLQVTLSSYADPARLMSHYINRELRKATGGAIPYAFTFDVSRAGRLHVHGVLVPGSFEEDRILAIDHALGKAGGKLKASNLTRLTQSYLGTLYDGLGWFAYLQKQGDRSMRYLGTEKVTFISTALRKICA